MSINPIPVSWCAIGAGVMLVAGAAAGWTVRDWKRDAEVLATLKQATVLVNRQRDVIDKAATAYEKDRQDAGIQTISRESTIREIYRDHPVGADCAAPDAVVGVLNDAVAAANARASGQPSQGLPAAAIGPGAAGQPR